MHTCYAFIGTKKNGRLPLNYVGDISSSTMRAQIAIVLSNSAN